MLTNSTNIENPKSEIVCDEINMRLESLGGTVRDLSRTCWRIESLQRNTGSGVGIYSKILQVVSKNRQRLILTPPKEQ